MSSLNSARESSTASSVQYASPRQPVARPRGLRRLPIIIMLLVSLSLTAVMQGLAQGMRTALVNPAGTPANLDSLSSFTLVLLLGGLRGPLVMILWMTSESQKQQRDLEDFGTKLELIRRLQPEFDSVQMFQIWNIVYNSSVLMSSLANKYETVLDGIDYAEQINRDRPNNLNLVSSLAQVYFEKLGNSQEKEYFIRRVRAESFEPIRLTMPLSRTADYDEVIRHLNLEQSQSPLLRDDKNGVATVIIEQADYRVLEPLFNGPGITYVNDEAWRVARTLQRPTRLEPKLDLHGNILRSLLAPNPDLVRPANLPPDSGWNNGAQLQYLEKYQPFTYGISPLALGYNYYKMAQVLANVTGQRHINISPMVIDDRPAIALKIWSEDEVIWARRCEIRAWGGDDTDEKVMLANTGYSAVNTARTPFSKALVADAPVEEALYSYALSARLVDDAFTEYERHIKHFSRGLGTYRQHMETLGAQKELALADMAYLKLAQLSGGAEHGASAQRAQLIADARSHYDASIGKYELLITHYYIPDNVAAPLFPEGYTHYTIGDKTHPISRGQLDMIATKALTILHDPVHPDFNDDRDEFYRYIARAQARIKLLADAK